MEVPEPALPVAVREAYGYGDRHRVERVEGGLINATYRVDDPKGGPIAALQRLHPVFGAEVNLDIEVITEHLATHGLQTPRLIRSLDERAWIEHEGNVWRAMQWVEGTSIDSLPAPALAESAGELVARFHRCAAELDHSFYFARTGVHDTRRHLKLLENCSPEAIAGEFDRAEEAGRVREGILARAAELPELPGEPKRICHGDLKASNILFRGQRAHCLIDLDTLGLQAIAYELGDALRSWANPAGENTQRPEIACELVEAAARGYASAAPGLLSEAEVLSVIPGLETVCVELAARFCVDIWQNAYFGWDPQRFSSRREHNLIRAKGQLSLAQSVARQRRALQELWSRAFGILDA